MDQKYIDSTLKESDILTAYAESVCPTANVKNVGVGVIIRHKNGGETCLYPVANNLCDIGLTTPNGTQREANGISWDDALELLKIADQIKTKVEQSITGELSPSSPPLQSTTGSFYSEVKKWWGDGKKFPRGHDSASLNLNEATTDQVRKFYHPDLGNFICDLLPFNRDLMRVDGDGKIEVELGEGRVEIIPTESANKFRVRTFVGTEQITAQDDVTREGLLKVATEIADKFNRLSQNFSTKSGDEANALEDEDEESYFEAMANFAKANGNPIDPIRNKDMVNLEGLGILESNGGNDAPLQTNPPAPFSNTLKGKVLRYVLGEGAVLVDKKDVPKQKFLSNSPDGVHWVTGAENVQRQRPKWRGWGRG